MTLRYMTPRELWRQEKWQWSVHVAATATMLGKKVTMASPNDAEASRFLKAVTDEIERRQSSQQARNADSPALSGSTRSSPNP